MSGNYIEEKISEQKKVIEQESYRHAQRLGISAEGIHNGTLDAFRHAYASARVAQEYGEGISRKAGYRHEQEHRNPDDEMVMDLHNNAFGLKIAMQGMNTSPEEIANRIYQQGIQQRGLITDLNDPRIESNKPYYLEQIRKNWLLTDLDTQPQAQFAVLEVPTRFVALHTQVGGHIKQLYTEKGVHWGDGGDNTVAACTVECVKQKVTDVQHASVGNGNIHLGQKMGYEWNVASIDAVTAARTPQQDSFAQLVAFDQQLSQQEDNPTQTQTKTRSGPTMG